MQFIFYLYFMFYNNPSCNWKSRLCSTWLAGCLTAGCPALLEEVVELLHDGGVGAINPELAGAPAVDELRSGLNQQNHKVDDLNAFVAVKLLVLYSSQESP